MEADLSDVDDFALADEAVFADESEFAGGLDLDMVGDDDLIDEFVGPDDFAFEDGDDAVLEDQGDAWDEGDEWVDGENDLPAALPKKPKRGRADGKASAAGGSRSGKSASLLSETGLPPVAVYFLFGLAGLVVLGLLGGAGFWMVRMREAHQQAMAVPDTYHEWQHPKGRLSARYPDGFTVSDGVAAGGVAPWAKFENDVQDVVITIRASMSGSALSDIAKAGSQAVGDLAKLPDEEEPVAAIHAWQREKLETEFDSYEETAPQVIETGFGSGRVSEFTRTKLFTTEYGLRATVIGGQFQYNILCRCPKDRLDEYRPVFEEVIRSVGS